MRLMPCWARAVAARRRKPAQEAGAGVGFLVGVDFGVGEAGVVVDGAVDVVVADPGGCAGAAVFGAVSAQHAPAAAVAEPAEFLDVDVDQLAWAGAFVAAYRLPGGAVQPRQTV
jgi:hypothetical protein